MIMKVSFKLVYAFLALVLITSCKEEVTAEQKELSDKISQYDTLKKEAMEVHDEIMPKMGVLMELKGQLKEQPQDSTMNSEYAVAQEKLQEAHDGMMEWMRDYSDKFPYGTAAPETLEALNQKMPILEEEVKEIKDLRDRTNKTIDYSKKLLVETEKQAAA
jgi:hypothetical protein